MRIPYSGEVIKGMVVAVIVTIVPFALCLAGPETHRSFSIPGDIPSTPSGMRLCVPVQEGVNPGARFTYDGRLLNANLIETAYIRDQRVAIYEIDEDLDGAGPLTNPTTQFIYDLVDVIILIQRQKEPSRSLDKYRAESKI